MKWIKCSDELPKLGDYSVIVYFSESNSVEMVHVQEYFSDITSGKVNGVQTYTKWYKTQKVSHWMKLPEAPYTKENKEE